MQQKRVKIKKDVKKLYYTYILECADKTLYCGYTTDLKRREREHNSGTGAKYTRTRLPVRVVYYEEFETLSEALRRECAIKKLTRCEKLELVRGKEK